MSWVSDAYLTWSSCSIHLEFLFPTPKLGIVFISIVLFHQPNFLTSVLPYTKVLQHLSSNLLVVFLSMQRNSPLSLCYSHPSCEGHSVYIDYSLCQSKEHHALGATLFGLEGVEFKGYFCLLWAVPLFLLLPESQCRFTFISPPSFKLLRCTNLEFQNLLLIEFSNICINY